MAVRTNWAVGLLLAVFVTFAVVEWKGQELGELSLVSETNSISTAGSLSKETIELRNKHKKYEVLDMLVDEGVYESTNFENEAGVIPPFWDENSTSICKPDETTTIEVGPCFGSHQTVDWQKQISHQQDPKYPALMTGTAANLKNKNDWAGHCRPGFLIIGAGKCGTSVR